MNDKKVEEKKPQKPEAKKDQRELLGLEPITTEHKLSLKGKDLKYSATAGVIPLKDDKGETEAEIFFTAYELDSKEDKSQRPLTFAFNGGPGSSSIWLHMGALGPKRVLMEKEGWGRIVNISSPGGTRVLPHYAAIGLSKAALESSARLTVAMPVIIPALANSVISWGSSTPSGEPKRSYQP
jgi:hypothetical protein